MAYSTILKAESLLDVGRPKEALRVLGDDPDTPTDDEALVTAARCHLEMREERVALDRLQSAAAIDPGNAETMLLLSFANRRLDDLDNALSYGKVAVSMRPNDERAHRNLSTIYCNLNGFDEARVHAHKALELDPDGPTGWLALSRLAIAEEKWVEAAAAARSALASEPENNEAASLLALTTTAGGGKFEKQHSIELLSQKLAQNPDKNELRELLVLVATADLGNNARTWAVVVVVILTQGILLPFILIFLPARAWIRWRRLPKPVRKLIWVERDLRQRLIALGIVAAIVFLALVAAGISIAVAA